MQVGQLSTFEEDRAHFSAWCQFLVLRLFLFVGILVALSAAPLRDIVRTSLVRVDF